MAQYIFFTKKNTFNNKQTKQNLAKYQKIVATHPLPPFILCNPPCLVRWEWHVHLAVQQPPCLAWCGWSLMEPIWTDGCQVTACCQHNKITTCSRPANFPLLSVTLRQRTLSVQSWEGDPPRQWNIWHESWGEIVFHFPVSFYMLILMDSQWNVFKLRMCILTMPGQQFSGIQMSN